MPKSARETISLVCCIAIAVALIAFSALAVYRLIEGAFLDAWIDSLGGGLLIIGSFLLYRGVAPEPRVRPNWPWVSR